MTANQSDLTVLAGVLLAILAILVCGIAWELAKIAFEAIRDRWPRKKK